MSSYTTEFSDLRKVLKLPEQAQPAPQGNTEEISSKCPGDILFADRHPEENKNPRIIRG